MGGMHFFLAQRKVFVWIKEGGGMLQHNVFEALCVYDSHDTTASLGGRAAALLFPASCLLFYSDPSLNKYRLGVVQLDIDFVMGGTY